MEIKEQITLKFLGVDFPSVQLSSTQPFVNDDDNKIKIDIQPRAFAPVDEPDCFKIIMDVDVSAENCFNLKVTGIGTFKLSREDISPEERKQFINANSTAIMFPYVRAFISILTSTLGKVTTPILLPTRFFKGDYLEESETDY